MNSKTATWFVCKIQYEKTQGDGMLKKVTEQYVIDALSFTEAEERITVEMTRQIGSDFTVKDISQAPFREVFFSDDASADKWFKEKIAFITLDEKTGKEKRSSYYFLVQSAMLEGATKVLQGTSITDYIISNISETQIQDVFVYKE